MTVKEFINGLLRTDLYELLIWSKWYFRSTRVTCKECVQTKAMGRGKTPDCYTCGLPTARLIKQHLEKETSTCSK